MFKNAHSIFPGVADVNDQVQREDAFQMLALESIVELAGSTNLIRSFFTRKGRIKKSD